MKIISILFLYNLLSFPNLYAQGKNTHEEAIYKLINDYAIARETGDAELLSKMLTPEIDQLVSSGTWRTGKKESMQGMMQSSSSNPGERKLTIDKIRFLDAKHAIVDCRYEIQNPDGSVRKMWSTFIIIQTEDDWKITAIRNMLPARPQ